MVAVFKKKTNKDKEEDAPPASPTAESYGGQPDVGGEKYTRTNDIRYELKGKVGESVLHLDCW